MVCEMNQLQMCRELGISLRAVKGIEKSDPLLFNKALRKNSQ